MLLSMTNNNPPILDNEEVRTAKTELVGYSDITLRDLIAIACLAGMQANHMYDNFTEAVKADLAYAQADAALQVRAKGGASPGPS